MKHIKLSFIYFVCFTNIQAQETSDLIAQQIAINWIEKINNIDSKTFTIKNVEPKYLNNKLIYKVVNFNEGGFVIVCGESGLNPIIAYNKNKSFVEEYLSKDEKEWMNFVEYIVENYRYKKKLYPNLNEVKQNEENFQLKSINTSSSVPSLFENFNSSRWAGWYPYSIDMPYDNGAQSCVPLAMAQIMKYYKYPIQGSGSNSYIWYDLTTPVTLSVNFNQEYYNYSNMPFRLTYCGNGQENCDEGSFDIIPGINEDQIGEVAKLIYHCGIAVEMDWRGQRTTGGGTYGDPGDWVQVMENNFNYSNNWTYLNETYISQNHESFKTSLRNEIENGRPVLFAYYGDYYNHGHALIIDGYEDDDYFHFAFGRGGADDTYYYLYNTDNDSQHDSLPYTTYYRATIGIEPDCINSLELNNITVSTSSIKAYQANNNIYLSSSGNYFIIDGNGTEGGKVIVKAGNSINLNAGFEIKKGGEIKIVIEECGIP